jgi:hypothetical protein
LGCAFGGGYAGGYGELEEVSWLLCVVRAGLVRVGLTYDVACGDGEDDVFNLGCYACGGWWVDRSAGVHE